MDQNQRTSRPNFRPDVEGLRAIAILLVVAAHARVPGLAGGFVGVDVFFVISGYLIIGHLINEIRTNGRIGFLKFYARRARRLLPGAFLMIVVTLAIAEFLLSPIELRDVSGAAAWQFAYVSNYFFLRYSLDYFSPSSALNPFLHTWSLSVEEQFYFLWPAFILVLGRLYGIRGIFWGTIVVTLVSFAACVWITGLDAPAGFYSTPTRAWEFGVGALALLWRNENVRLNQAISLTGLAMVLVSAVLFTGDMLFPGYAAALPVLGTVGIIAAGNRATAPYVNRALSLAPMQAIGSRSYSWYLWHWPMIVFADVLIPGASLLARLAVMAAAFVLAVLSTDFVENPIRWNAFLVRRVRVSLAMALTLAVVGIGAALVERSAAFAALASPEIAPIAHAKGATPLERRHCMGRIDKPATCDFGDPASATRVVLFGDSHAAQLFLPLRDVSEKNHWKLTPFTKPGCSAADVERLFDSFAHGLNSDCNAWRAAVFKKIIGMRPAAVIISEYSQHYIGTLTESGTSDPDRIWQSGLRATLAAFNKAGIAVILIRDFPDAPFDVPICLSRPPIVQRLAGTSCNWPKTFGHKQKTWQMEKAAAKGLPSVFPLDLTGGLCRGGVCHGMTDGIVMLRDNHHLSNKFALSLTPSFQNALVPVISKIAKRKSDLGRARPGGSPPENANAPG